MKFVIWGLLISMVWIEMSFALPSSSRLYQNEYGYRPSCQACHLLGGGSRLNNYGNDFLKAGRTLQAFVKIAQVDSDGDGVINAVEAEKKSNPGAKKSTPSNPQDWLKGVQGVFIPKEDLQKLYPEITEYKGLEGRLSDEQMKKASSFGVTLVDDDRVPTFYFPIKNKKRIGIAQIMTVEGPKGTLGIGIAVALSGSIQNVIPLNSKNYPNVSSLAIFQSLRQQSIREKEILPSVIAKSEVEKKILEGVRRAVVAMRVVFSRK